VNEFEPLAMGFKSAAAASALRRAGGDVDAATDFLLDGDSAPSVGPGENCIQCRRVAFNKKTRVYNQLQGRFEQCLPGPSPRPLLTCGMIQRGSRRRGRVGQRGGSLWLGGWRGGRLWGAGQRGYAEANRLGPTPRPFVLAPSPPAATTTRTPSARSSRVSNLSLAHHNL